MPDNRCNARLAADPPRALWHRHAPRRAARRVWLPLLVGALLLASCGGTLDVIVEGTPTPTGTSAPAPVTGDATMPAPTASPTHALRGVPPPPGLAYRLGNGLWLVGADGQPVSLSDRPGAVLSPDGTQVLYQDDGIWLADVSGGEPRSLTGGFEIVSSPQWWPARPDIALFTIRNANQEAGPGILGYPAAVGLDGSGLRILDDQHDAGPGLPAPSPDGQTLAYGGGQSTPAGNEGGWLYRWDRGAEPFDPQSYGLTGSKGVRIGSPSWSPDGRRLAWIVGGGFGAAGDWRLGVAVFDLEAKTARLLHPYEPLGVGGWPAAAAWSPDGKWLSFFAHASERGQYGRWVVRADGLQQEEYHLAGDSAAWSPDGQRIALSGATPDETGPWLAAAPDFSLQAMALPAEAQIVGWITPK